MRLGGGRFRLHRSVAVVLVVGIVASTAGFAYAAAATERNDRVLLRQQAEQASLVLGAFLNEFQQSVTHLGSLVTSGGSQAAFSQAATKTVGQDGGGSVALLQVRGTHLEVVASAGGLHRSFGGPDDAALIPLVSDSAVHYLAVVSGTKQRFTEELQGPPAVPSGYALYWELPTAPVIPLSSIPGLPFSGVNAAVYLGHEQASDLLFATTRSLPLQGERAAVDMGNLASLDFHQAKLGSKPGFFSAPGNLIIVMVATGHLSGISAAIFPWVLLFVGLAATLAVGAVLSLALRRRDEALGLVREMKEKNEALDRAIKRQADAEEGLRQAQRLEAVGQLAGGVAHDFNNLLHVILSYAGFLDDAIDPWSPLRPDVLEIQNAARRAAELTRQLLVFARGEVVRPAVVDANVLVRDTERLLAHTLGEEIELHVSTAGEPCWLVVDVGEMNQVLMNVALNARDAMPRGGRLDIEVRRVELPAGSAAGVGLKPGSHVRIDVVDTGEGMSREVASRAFEPFFTTKETGRGTGLGLSMVYGIVARWKGFVSLSSSPGKGTTVTTLFPMAEEGAIPPEAGASPLFGDLASTRAPRVDAEAQSGEPSSTVLLVEDEEGVRRSTARILQSAGHRVLQAKDAAEAEQVFGENRVDLVVTDIVMPGGVSGKELADRLQGRRPDLPIVFVTGYGSDTVAERGVLSSHVTLVEKPFSADSLLRTVASSLSSTGASS